MIIRDTQADDLDTVKAIHRSAFGEEEEAALVADLLQDASAEPVFSLLAEQEGRPVGHILFTRAWLEPPASTELSLLAPLAVIPEAQNRGIGGQLIEHGLRRLTQSGIGLVFVLGHPGYYPRYGFSPAGVHGLQATYPIDEKNAGAWMVRELRPGILGTLTGRVICADSLNDMKYWVE